MIDRIFRQPKPQHRMVQIGAPRNPGSKVSSWINRYARRIRRI
jgi:hypothetical protein